MSRYSIEESSLSAIADKIREKKYIDDELTPAQIAEELDGMGLPLNIDETPDYYCAEPWTRPSEYPDLDSIDLTDFDGVYMTYDLRKTEGYGWIGLYSSRTLNFPTYIERGHLDENGAFITDEQYAVGNNEYFRRSLNNENGDVQLWRIWSEGRLTRISFVPNSAVNAECIDNNLQPCVERRGRLPYVTNASSSPNNTSATAGAFATRWLLRDDLHDLTQLTTMANAYSYCTDLCEVHFDGWDTSLVTIFASCFNRCFNLRSIPLQNLTTPKATTIASMFAYCRSLRSIDISHFDLTKITTMSAMCDNCVNLRHMVFPENGGTGALTNASLLLRACRSMRALPENFEKLNVTNVTSLNYTFSDMRYLESADLHDWNVTKVTNISYLFSDCNAIRHIDVSGWDVSQVISSSRVFAYCWSLHRVKMDGWELSKATIIDRFFADCYSLEETDLLSRIDFSVIANLSSVFAGCRSLKDIGTFNCAGDNAITTMSYMFQNCWVLRKIHMPNMHFTVGVSISNLFDSCRCLTDLDVHGWTFVKINDMAAIFTNCWMLKEIDLSDWVITDNALIAKNAANYMFNALQSCRSINFPRGIAISEANMSYFMDSPVVLESCDLRGMDMSDATNSFVPSYDGSALRDYYPPYFPAKNVTLSANRMLTRDSLLSIFEHLPITATKLTITIGQANKNKLTPEEIAIATDKGWTVA